MAQTTAFTMEYEFEEINVCGEGLMAWGSATLTHDYGSEFYVSGIILKDGSKLDRHGTGKYGFPSAFNKSLFLAIADQVENSDHAQRTFSRALEDQRSDPDRAYEERHDTFMQAAE